jgi:hypothetical protein
MIAGSSGDRHRVKESAGAVARIEDQLVRISGRKGESEN